MKISAAIARSPDAPFSIESFDIEEPRSDELLVRIVASGICHTDIAVKDQDVKLPLPMILGHEGAGIVEKVGSSITHVSVGDHVVLSGDSCGQCRKCQQGLPSYCDDFVERNLTGRRIDGTSPTSMGEEEVNGRFCGQSSFATHTVVSSRSAIKVHESYPIELMGPLGCGLTTGVGTVMNALRPPAGSSIAIFGAGTVGLAAVMGATLTGCAEIIVIDPLEARRSIALELGATRVLDAADPALVEEILSLTHGGADFSVECSGVPAAVENAVKSLARPGWCAQVGATPAGTLMPLDMDHLGFGRGIKGVVMGDANAQSFVPYLSDLHAQGKLPYDRFVKFYEFDEVNQAVADSKHGDVVKPVLRITT